MSARTTSRARRIVSRITDTWAEMDHAQRRKLEIQTGITGLTRGRQRTAVNGARDVARRLLPGRRSGYGADSAQHACRGSTGREQRNT